MNQDLIPVYFIPGLAANKEIFKNIKLPEDEFKVHFLDWLIPDKKETLQEYAKRMAERVKEKNAVLIGVSFGGVVAQEMEQFLQLRKLIIISSIKTKDELPLRLKIARKAYLYKLVPTGLILKSKDLTKFSLNPKMKKRLQIYQQYLSVRDKDYLDWAIEKMVTWDRNTPVEGVVHIHGEKDLIFPVANLKNYIEIPNGTHIMILNKFRWLNKHLPEIIRSN